MQAFQEFAGGQHVKSFYCDNARELMSAAKELHWMNPTSEPYVPQSNGLAERMVRTSKEGARALLVQSGLSNEWWPYAIKAFCFARNSFGHEAPYFTRYGTHCNAKQIPFGALVDFQLPVRPAKDDNPGPFDSQKKLGIFLGWHTQPGGVFSGTYLVAEFETFKTEPDIGPSASAVHIHRTAQVDTPGVYHCLSFPLADYRKKSREVPVSSSDKEVSSGADAPPEEVVTDNRVPVPLPDTRGQGLESFDGKRVRKWTGSTRPPDVHPQVWSRLYTAIDQQGAIKDYLDKLKKGGEPPGGGPPAATAAKCSCLLYPSPSPRPRTRARMAGSA